MAVTPLLVRPSRLVPLLAVAALIVVVLPAYTLSAILSTPDRLLPVPLLPVHVANATANSEASAPRFGAQLRIWLDKPGRWQSAHLDPLIMHVAQVSGPNWRPAPVNAAD